MYSHVSIIPADNFIAVDGEGLVFPFPAPAAIHAIQWHSGAGHVEYADGSPNRTLAAADYEAVVAPYVILWETEQARLEEEDNRPPTPEEQQRRFTAAIQARLDAFAQTRGYDNIHSAASYDGDPDQVFAAEGKYAKEARSATWRMAYGILDQVLAGQRSMPTVEEVFAELPPLTWPEVIA